LILGRVLKLTYSLLTLSQLLPDLCKKLPLIDVGTSFESDISFVDTDPTSTRHHKNIFFFRIDVGTDTKTDTLIIDTVPTITRHNVRNYVLLMSGTLLNVTLYLLTLTQSAPDTIKMYYFWNDVGMNTETNLFIIDTVPTITRLM